ncbi:MAG: hypothetical protein WAT39_21950 [Planctomycetota bacterium]
MSGVLVFDEAWADVKSPGGDPTTQVAFPTGFPTTAENRLTYAVGTIEVNFTLNGFFSNSPQPVGTGGGNGPPAFGTVGPVTKQVAMLQINLANQTPGLSPILSQTYFYGTQAGFPTVVRPDRATNARAVSVWGTGNAGTDRIAICGETYEDVLPASQAPGGWGGANPTTSSGFIAVFDGNANLLWSHHFFDPADPGDQACAITDVSIRVENGIDVVTYCGISTHGGFGGGELAPLLPFPAVGACNGGAPPHPAGQWDGFVGRVIGTTPASSIRVFHSIVGDVDQDGLFGIAEIDINRFAVVGSVELVEAAQSRFPFTSFISCGLQGPFVVGSALVFDAVNVPAGALTLERSSPIGNAGEGFVTVARDVIIGRETLPGIPTALDQLYVVDSTNVVETTPFTCGARPFAVPPPPGLNVLQGPSDGFLAALALVPAPNLQPWTFAYHGGPGGDGLTGINNWGECREHMAVTGFTDDGAGGGDIDVATYFFNNAPGPNSFNGIGPANPAGHTGQVNDTLQFIQLRRNQYGGVLQERPAAMGPINTTITGTVPWNQFGLGQESGGGVAVGNDGRINVVGVTIAGSGYPVLPVGGVALGPDLGFDAVRTEVDLVPGGPGNIGVGRTDGTGWQLVGAGPYPPPAPATGGTTPFCLLAPYGDQVGLPAPALGRMLIDFEGALLPGSFNAAIVVSRPPATAATFSVGAIQINFPPAVPWTTITGCEFWLGGPGTVNVTFAAFGPARAYRLPLFQLPNPSPGIPISAQLFTFTTPAIAGAFPGCASQYAASPALWFNW